MALPEDIKARRREATARGLCSTCWAQPVQLGKAQCLACREKRRARYRRERGTGLCGACHNVSDRPHKSVCSKCAVTHASRRSVERASRSAAGKCPDCGADPRPGRKFCDACNLKDAAWRYRTTYDLLAQTLKAQDNKCAVCRGVNADGRLLMVDHDHETGRFRAFLCSSCNVAIGMAQDSSQRLRELAEYLDRFSQEG